VSLKSAQAKCAADAYCGMVIATQGKDFALAKIFSDYKKVLGLRKILLQKTTRKNNACATKNF